MPRSNHMANGRDCSDRARRLLDLAGSPERLRARNQCRALDQRRQAYSAPFPGTEVEHPERTFKALRWEPESAQAVRTESAACGHRRENTQLDLPRYAMCGPMRALQVQQPGSGRVVRLGCCDPDIGGGSRDNTIE